MTKREVKEKALSNSSYSVMAKENANTMNEIIYTVVAQVNTYGLDKIKADIDNDKYFLGMESGIGMIGIKANCFSEMPFEKLTFRTRDEIDEEVAEYGVWD